MKKFVRQERANTQTGNFHRALSTIMKGFGFRHPQTSDDASEDIAGSLAQSRTPARRVVSVLLVAVLLACAEREISGAANGSLLSLFTGQVGDGQHHLLSILLNYTR